MQGTLVGRHLGALFAVTGVAGLVSLGTPAPVAAGVVTSQVALIGDVASETESLFGEPFRFTFLGGPLLDDSGQSTFLAQFGATVILEGWPDPISISRSGILRGAGGPITSIMREFWLSPVTSPLTTSGLLSYGAPQSFKQNNAGQVAFRATLIDGSSGIFRGDGGPADLIALQNTAAPGGGVFRSFSDFDINNAGQVLFQSCLSTTCIEGLFRGDGNTTTRLARSGDAAPGSGGGTFATFSDPQLNDAGQGTFIATVNNSTSLKGIFRGGDGAVQAIARTLDSTPDGFLIRDFREFDVNQAGQAAFVACLNASCAGTGLYVGDGTTTTAIARQGSAAPGSGGGVLVSFNGISVNNAGSAGFYSQVSDGTTLTEGIFRGDGTVTTAIARTGDAAPGAGGAVFRDLNPSATLLDSGTVGFSGIIGPSGPITFLNRGYWLGDGQETIELVREGGALAGSTVAALSFGSTLNPNYGSFNQHGQLSFTAALADGRSGVFIVTPDLHWRSAVGGAWDDTGNWTVGLRPGEPHRVFIDTASNVTIAGPASDVAVKELTVGGGAGSPTLNLNGGGALTVAGDLSVHTGAVVSVASGSSVASGATTLAGGTINAATAGIGPEIFGALPPDLQPDFRTGSLRGHGTVNASIIGFSSAQITASGGALTLGNAASSNGFLYTGSLDVGAEAVTLNSAGLSVLGASTTLTGGSLSAANGLALVTGRSLSGHGTVNDRFVSQGTVTGSGPGLLFTGDVSGPGSYLGTSTFTGTFRPGDTPVQGQFPAQVLFETLVLPGNLQVDLGGHIAGSEYDQLLGAPGVFSSITLGGMLDVSLIAYAGRPVFAPVLGDVFDIIIANDIIGDFLLADYPLLTGGLFFTGGIITLNDGREAYRLVVTDGATAAPAPAAGLILLTGLGGLVWLRRRQGRAA